MKTFPEGIISQLIVLGCTVTSDEGFHFMMFGILNVDQLFTTTRNIPTYHHDADRTDTHTSAAGVSNPKKIPQSSPRCNAPNWADSVCTSAAEV